MSSTLAQMAAGAPGGHGSIAGRIALVVIAVAAVGTFTVLQIMARSGRRQPPAEPRRRRYDPSDWRVPPPPYATAGHGGEEPSGNAEQHRPDWRYGYPPGYDPGVQPSWTAGDDARRGRGRSR